MNLQKPKREKDEKYLAWIRTQKCLVCHVSQNPIAPVDAHHVREKGKGGVGTKPSDFRAVPLCRDAHAYYHAKGRERFESEMGVNLESEILRLNREFQRLHPSPRRRTVKCRVRVNVQHCGKCGREHSFGVSSNKLAVASGAIHGFWCGSTYVEVG